MRLLNTHHTHYFLIANIFFQIFIVFIKKLMVKLSNKFIDNKTDKINHDLHNSRQK